MKRPSLARRLVLVLLWSAISAAFIGPGTVTTAAKAGAGHGLSLLWALVFSTLACLTLQEASARVTIATGQPLGRVIRQVCGGNRVVPLAILGAVLLGCAAYEMGNILGAVAGLSLGIGLSPTWLTLGCVLVAGVVLWVGTARAVAKLLGLVVAVMGLAFLFSAINLRPDLGKLLEGCLVPAIPPGAGILVLALVGTTVVPYNLFLGSGLAHGQTLVEARLGLAIAIPLGGLISAGIVVVGTTVSGDFSFLDLAAALTERLGEQAKLLLAVGLFAAGLSSTITAPLAAALAVRGFASRPASAAPQVETSGRYRSVWVSVLLFGFGFGLADIQPIPAIVLAQAINGVLLPLVAVVLWLVVNNRNLMGETYLVGHVHNTWLGFCVLITFVLGATGILRALARVLGLTPPGAVWQLLVAGLAAVALAPLVIRTIQRGRTGHLEQLDSIEDERPSSC